MRQQVVKYCDNSIRWHFNNKQHRDGDLPARYYFVDGKLYSISYRQHGWYHSTTGPAYINYVGKWKKYYYQNRRYSSLEKMLMMEMQMRQRVLYWNDYIRWYFSNNYHRDGDLPAAYNFTGGKLYAAYYYQHGKLHCTTGPAIINYEDKIKSYFYQGRKHASLGEMQMLETCR